MLAKDLPPHQVPEKQRRLSFREERNLGLPATHTGHQSALTVYENTMLTKTPWKMRCKRTILTGTTRTGVLLHVLSIQKKGRQGTSNMYPEGTCFTTEKPRPKDETTTIHGCSRNNICSIYAHTSGREAKTDGETGGWHTQKKKTKKRHFREAQATAVHLRLQRE